MRLTSVAALLAGIALFGWVMTASDVGLLWQHLLRLGWAGMAITAMIGALWVFTDVAAWLLTLPALPFTVRWLGRLTRVLAIGEAVNNLTPLVPLGGEPIKALLLNRRYGIGYGDAASSLILAQALILMGHALFVTTCLVLVMQRDDVPAGWRTAAAATLVTIAVLGTASYLVPRLRLLSQATHRLTPRRWRHQVDTLVGALARIEGQIETFFARTHGRFCVAMLLAAGAWFVEALEVWIILMLLQLPASAADAVIIAGLVSVARAASFFIPSAVGAQEGAYFVVTAAVLGTPEPGLAVAVLRRVRELAWMAFGLGAGWDLLVRRHALAGRRSAAA
ncbi:MAG: flippase-like domain-containing protein [Gammaproteobacteria bacterium]|nr:flippase-like domain-containing protein [Gammaproteobacteria bacterium]